MDDVEAIRAKNADLELEVAALKRENATLKRKSKLKIADLETKLADARTTIGNLRDENIHMDGRILELKDAGPKIANTYIHPKLVNVSIENIRPLTIDTVRADVCKYTYEESLRGLPGLQKFVESVITNHQFDDPADYERNYVCTDTARNKFHRLVESREWVADGGANFLHTILDELRPTAKDHFQALVDQEIASTSDEFERIQIDATKAVVRPVYRGIMESGDNRDRLFKALRNKIKDAAFV